MVLPYFLCACFALFINYLIAREFYRVARMKGYSQKKFLWLPFFFGIIGYLLVAALPVNINAPSSAAQNLPDEQLPEL